MTFMNKTTRSVAWFCCRTGFLQRFSARILSVKYVAKSAKSASAYDTGKIGPYTIASATVLHCAAYFVARMKSGGSAA